MNPIVTARTERRVLAIVAGLLIAIVGRPGARGDVWPMYRHDASRSGITNESLTLPLQMAWRYECAQPPSPAWPPPHFIILNRLDFDDAPQPVVANRMVCFGSSTDDTVRALDLATGRLRWRFITGGPVRLAPQIDDGRVYLGSDDGCAYCVDATSGQLVWKFNAAPHEEQFIGNGRMISRWPIRTGVLVDDGVAYLLAGMWATEGVYAYALDAKTGRTVWCNDTCGYAGVDYNRLLTPDNAGEMRHGVHDGDFGVYGLTPQGALATTRGVLLIPNGYNSPAGLDRQTGRLLYADPQAGTGGHWLTVDGDAFYATYRHRNKRLLVMKKSARTGQRIGMQHRSIHNLTSVPDPRAPHLHHEDGKTSVLMHNGRAISHNAYSMVLAQEMLLLGRDRYVVALDAKTDAELWRAPVDGKAYELAVADGRLIVGTDRGTVYCFAPSATTATEAHVLERPDASPRPRLVEVLKTAGMDRGYALVLGDTTGQLSETVSQSTDLHIVTLLDDKAAAKALRARLVDTTALYGSRIHVQTYSSARRDRAPSRETRLPFAPYFANAVIIANRTPPSGQELFRVSRPCGGVMLFVGEGRTEFDRVCSDLAAELKNREATKAAGDDDAPPAIIRGQLPGALDWNSDHLTDQRVRWPLRPLWFGGPSSAQVTDYKNGNARPPAAYGRYFVLGEDTLTAVDAYNGCLLWSRPIPPRSPDLRKSDGLLYFTERVWTRELRDAHNRSLRVNDTHVYLTLADGVFRGIGSGCIVINARTGQQEAIYAPYQPSPNVRLDVPATWPLKVDDAHAGQLTLAKSADGITVRMQTTDPVVTRLDEWDLFFDFRPAEDRYGLYEPGVFHVRIIPPLDPKMPATWVPGAGVRHPQLRVGGRYTPDGCEVKVTLPWNEIRRVAGRKADDFGFAAALNSHDGGRDERIRQRYQFCDFAATGINNGWANVSTDTSATPSKTPSIVAGALDDLPKVRTARSWPRAIDSAVGQTLRVHPLTGELGPRIFRSGTGTCGGFDFSTTSVIKRGGAAKVLSIYDFAEDSGLHTFIGTSAACAASTTTALGLVIASESRARCVCTYPFRTTVALAPDQRRLNEDWAIFYDHDVDTRVKQAAINLGAFGDRRDSEGKLWLGFPRAVAPSQALGYAKLPGSKTEAFLPGVWPIARSANLQVPLKVECYEGGGPYRFNADRTTIAGTNRPWLYASGYRGIRRATLQLNFGPPLTAKALDRPPTLDAKTADNEWPAEPQGNLPGMKTEIFLAHDDHNLYLAARRPATFDRHGKVQWTGKTGGDDVDVWNDDSWEVFLGDAAGTRVVHFAVSITGARYDAIAIRDVGIGKSTVEDRGWNGNWQSSATADETCFVVELAIPWKTLDQAGLDRNTLAFNCLMNRTAQVGEALTYLGAAGRAGCTNFTPLGLDVAPPVASRRFQVRLHFAEPDDAPAGRRVFDVKLQGRDALNAFDLVREAGAAYTALIREFSGIDAVDTLSIEFVPSRPIEGESMLPILCAIEVCEEGFHPPTGRAP